MGDMPKLMGVSDVKDFLGVSRQYVVKLANDKRLPFAKTSSGMIFLESDVREFKKKWQKEARIRKSDKRFSLNKKA